MLVEPFEKRSRVELQLMLVELPGDFNGNYAGVGHNGKLFVELLFIVSRGT
jgi:hypothetical protein